MRHRRRAVVAVVVALLVLLGLLLGAVAGLKAAGDRQQSRVRVPYGTVVAGNFAADAGTVEIYGDIRGNVRVHTVYLNQVGSVGGDLTVTAGRVELRGAIGGSVRAMGGSLNLYGRIGGDVEMTGGEVRIVEGAEIDGDLIMHGGQLTVVATSRIGGDLRGTMLSATIEGTIAGDVDLTTRRLVVAPGAVVGGIQYESRAIATIDSRATVTGAVARRDPADRFPAGRLLFWHSAAIPRLTILLVLGGVLTMLSPRSMASPADALRRAPAAVTVCGFGVALFAPLALLVAALFVFTIPLVAIGIALYLAAAYFSMATVGLALGRAVLRRPVGEASRPADLLALCLGTGAVAAIRVLPAPFLDITTAAITAIVGMGAVVMSRRRPMPQAEAARRDRGWLTSVLRVAAGMLSGSAVVVLAVAAVIVGAVGGVAAVATLSRTAVLVWRIPPQRIGAIALLLAAAAIATAIAAAIATRRLDKP